MLRVACDLDGTLADLSRAYRRVEEQVHGDSDGLVWDAIRNIENFWVGLDPIEPGIVRRLFEVSKQAKWEMFFVTQRPGTAGDSVQRQTQQWLMNQGFETPSVLTVPGSRGKAAQALDLDFLIDDLPRNCIEVASDSRCRPLLVARNPDQEAELAAARFKISVVHSVSDALDIIVANMPQVRETSRSQSWLKRLGLGLG
jgi:hypothetical protein